MSTRQRAGTGWRVLVHEPDGASHSIAGDPAWIGTTDESDLFKKHLIEGAEFDEVVLGGGVIHAEEMGGGVWWISIAGHVLMVRADRNGRPVEVVDHGVEDPQDGCTYRSVNRLMGALPEIPGRQGATQPLRKGTS